ncbi:hemerythrin domain-containing protein [Rhodospirillum sp. A1_3_36]|uniref:hemerythrin domain-containing protein n=1 Tax=Rhodospirillum sp. A1_3_36 TaxID=3391666 RepID=UPI0039A70B5F
MRPTVTIIRTEHRRLAAVIDCFVGVLRDLNSGKSKAAPDVDLLQSIHNYFRSFLYTFHHPKEEEHLFPSLAARVPALAEVIDRLEGEHARGLEMLDNLDRALEALRAGATDDLSAYLAAAESYQDLEWKHMALEERDILPLAQKALESADWDRLDAIFTDHEDPIFGDKPRAEYESLLTAIVNRAPSPHGLG